jgi:hypothetical protein
MCGKIERDASFVLQEIGDALAKLSSEERIYGIVKLFFQIEESDERVEAKFWHWMLSPENRKEKESAMERIFAECMDEKVLKDNSVFD